MKREPINIHYIMAKILERLTILAVIAMAVCSNSFYKKIVHNTDPEAKCLDGSSPAVYVHQGSEPSKIFIMLIGGGTCAQEDLQSTLVDCAIRSKTLLGSSLFWPDYYDSKGLGILDVTLQDNKFAEWTKVVVMYCDGTIYQGNNKDPIDVNGTTIYFRGSVIMKSHFRWIENQYGLNKAQKIVLTGFSAGGFGTYLWVDYLRSLVDDPDKVQGIVDSAMYLNPEVLESIEKQRSNIALLSQTKPLPSNPLAAQLPPLVMDLSTLLRSSPLVLSASNLKTLIQITNPEGSRPPNQNCVKSLTGTDSDWKCLFTQYALQYLDAKLLWINWQYDEYIIRSVLDMDCLSEGTTGYTLKKCSPFELVLFDLYRGLVKTEVIDPLIEKGHSVWSIACSWHSGLFYNDIYSSNRQRAPYYNEPQYTVKKAFEEFVFNNRKIVAVDEFPWPSNRLCAF